MQKRTFDDFDAFAPSYRESHNKNLKISGADSAYFAEMKVQILQRYECNDLLNFLDIGCGDGLTEVFIKKYFPQWKISGVDVSEASINEARKRNIEGADFLSYNGEATVIKNETVDVIFIAGVLHHINKSLHSNILLEAKRVLKPGGRIYLFEHNPFNPLTRYLVNTCVFDRDARLLNYYYTMSVLKKVNFMINKKQFIIFLPIKGLLSKFRFMEKYLHWLPLGGQYFFRAIKK